MWCRAWEVRWVARYDSWCQHAARGVLYGLGGGLGVGREVKHEAWDLVGDGGEHTAQPKEASSRMLRKRFTAETSKLGKPPKANGRERKQSTKRSILSPVNPTKVSKAPGKSRISHQKMSIPCDILQTAEKTTNNSSIPKYRRKQVSKAKDTVPPSLRPIHSSRVSKPGKTQPAGLRIDGTRLSSATNSHRLKGEDNLGMLLAASTDMKASKPLAKSSPRRNTRRLKKT